MSENRSNNKKPISVNEALAPIAEDFSKTFAKWMAPSGDIAGELVYKSFSALKWTADQAEEYVFKPLREKVEIIPEEKRLPPPGNLIIDVIPKISANKDNAELRELFINLLATSMNSETAQLVHPSYARTISELAPDEARLISCFRGFEIAHIVMGILLNNENSRGFVFSQISQSSNIKFLELSIDPNPFSRPLKDKNALKSELEGSIDNLTIERCTMTLSRLDLLSIPLSVDTDIPALTRYANPNSDGGIYRAGVIGNNMQIKEEFKHINMGRTVVEEFDELIKKDIFMEFLQENPFEGIKESSVKLRKYNLTDYGKLFIIACC